MLPDFLKKCLETKLNIAELHQVCSAELAAQGKGFFFVFIIIFYYFFSLLQEITHFSAVEERSNWSRALQFAFRNGFILDVGIKFR